MDNDYDFLVLVQPDFLFRAQVSGRMLVGPTHERYEMSWNEAGTKLACVGVFDDKEDQRHDLRIRSRTYDPERGGGHWVCVV